MNKSVKIIIAVVAIIILSLNFGLKPYLNQRDFKNVLLELLQNWENGQLDLAINKWASYDQAPPIFGLKSYEIKHSSFARKDGSQIGEFDVELNLPENATLPQNATWHFVLSKTPYGIKVTDFSLIK